MSVTGGIPMMTSWLLVLFCSVGRRVYGMPSGASHTHTSMSSTTSMTSMSSMPSMTGMKTNGPTVAPMMYNASDPYNFFFKWDMFASETGYFTVEGHEGFSPALSMEVGKSYMFHQHDPSNYFHPLGFSYSPDGPYDGVFDALGMDVGDGDVPKYYINGQRASMMQYMTEFTYPQSYWKANTYMVELTINSFAVHQVFYMCHQHAGMSGPISIVGGNAVTSNYQATPPKELYQPDAFDSTCGTWEISDYSPSGNYTCEAEAVCIDSGLMVNTTESQFVQCMNALDCKMQMEMNTTYSGDMVATFMQQMIPHHQNAVNMAKTLLKLGGTLEQQVHDMMVDIVNGQNAQITYMRIWLNKRGFTEQMTCEDRTNSTMMM